MRDLKRASRVLSRDVARSVEAWLMELGKIMVAHAAPDSPRKRRLVRTGQPRVSNVERIQQAIGKQGARIKDIATRTGIAAPNVSNYVSQNPKVFARPAVRGGLVQLKA